MANKGEVAWHREEALGGCRRRRSGWSSSRRGLSYRGGRSMACGRSPVFLGRGIPPLSGFAAAELGCQRRRCGGGQLPLLKYTVLGNSEILQINI